MISTESVDCVVFESSEEARRHGKGGIWYKWLENSSKAFPADVSDVGIVMPVGWGDPDIPDTGISTYWSISYKNSSDARWQLSGTFEKPTLYPSLNWVGMWHGWLKAGYLESC